MKRSDYIAIRNKFQFRKNEWSLVLHIVKDLILVASLIFFWNQPHLKFIAFPFLSVLIARSFSLMHDASHGSISRFKWINTVAGAFYGGVGLVPFEQWKASHLKHHLWSGNVEKDPVMALLIAYPKMGRGLKAVLNFGWKHWIPTLSMAQHTVFWILSVRNLKESEKSITNIMSALSPLAFWIGLSAFTPSGFVPFVIIPAIFFYLIGTEIINLPHHVQLITLKGDDQLKAWDQYKSARSCIYPEWIAKNIVLNFNYHVEHHMFPDAPWYYLDSIHQETKAALGNDLISDPYLAWILRNRKRALGEVLYMNVEDDKIQVPKTKIN